MNYNFLNTNLLTNMCNYNTTGASLTPYLFSGVDGLSIFTNYNNGYGSYGNYGYGSCSNTSSGVWGAIGLALGSVAASIGIGVTGKAINNHIAKNNAKEAQNKKDVEAFNKAIAELGLSGKSPLEITEAMLDEAAKKDSNLKNSQKLNDDIRTAETREAETNKALETAIKTELPSLKNKMTSAEKSMNEAFANWQKTPDNSGLKDIYGELKKAYEEAKAAYDELEAKTKEPDGELYKAHEQAKKDLEKAEQAQKDALDKLQEQADIAKQYLAKAQEAAREKLEGDIDDVDGNAFSRIGAKEVTIKDGNIEGNVDNFKDADWQKILAKWRKGDTAQKANIEAWLEENAEDINKSQINSTYRSFLNKICNKINVDNSES